jgi:hypothetical protein
VTVLGILMTALLFAGLAKSALWLADRGTRDRDLPLDALSVLARGPDETVLVDVVNPSESAVAVGRRTRRQVAPGLVHGLVPTLVIRAATRAERRRLDRGASEFLGAVEARSTRTWRIPSAHLSGPSRCLVYLGQPGGRLRVHDHVVPPRPTFASPDRE